MIVSSFLLWNSIIYLINLITICIYFVTTSQTICPDICPLFPLCFLFSRQIPHQVSLVEAFTYAIYPSWSFSIISTSQIMPPSYNCISIDTFSIKHLQSLLIRSDSDVIKISFELLQYFILLLSVLWVFIYLSLLKLSFKHLMSYNCVILKPTWVWSSALLLINVTLGHLLNVPSLFLHL